MVAFIYILFHQCCRTSKLSPLLIRGCSFPLGHPSGSLGEWQQFCATATSPSRQAGMLGIFTFSIPPVWGGREEQAGETQFRIKWNAKGVRVFFLPFTGFTVGILQPSIKTREMREGMYVQWALVSLLSLCPDQEKLSSTADRVKAAVRGKVEQEKLSFTHRKELSNIQDEMLSLRCSGQLTTQL